MRRVPRRSQVSGSTARRRVVDRLQESVINPLDKLAFMLGMPPRGDALLETTGRRTGRSRVTPVCDGTEGDTFWIVAQHGHSEVFSTDWSLGDGQDQSCSGDRANPLRAQPDVA